MTQKSDYSFDVRVGDQVICRDGVFQGAFRVSAVMSGHVAVDVGGLAMPLPLRVLEMAAPVAAA